MCKVYGYCRISTSKQSIERQIRNIKEAYPDAIIIEEVYTGTKTDGREKFEKLCKQVKHGDTIIFDSVSRMSRNAGEGFALYQDFFNRDIELVFLKEQQINTATYKEAANKQIETISTGDEATDELTSAIMAAINKYMMRLAEKQIKIAFEQAEKEVADLHQRTREGIETARLAGKQIGKAKGQAQTMRKEAPIKALIKKHSKDFDGVLADDEVIALIKGSTFTIKGKNGTEVVKPIGTIARNTYYKYKREIKLGL